MSHFRNGGLPDRVRIKTPVGEAGLELEIEILLIMAEMSHCNSPLTFPLYYHHFLSPC